jgi:hypothetical protein
LVTSVKFGVCCDLACRSVRPAWQVTNRSPGASQTEHRLDATAERTHECSSSPSAWLNTAAASCRDEAEKVNRPLTPSAAVRGKLFLMARGVKP